LRIPSKGCYRLKLSVNIPSNDKEKPISAGFYRLEAGKELVYPYTYNEMKIILEGFRLPQIVWLIPGQFEITDETGYKVTAKPGDVFYFEKGILPERSS
jgi:ethanolamine utilization protein EutQ (cupin superfamily)